jgi:hypothetical protein
MDKNTDRFVNVNYKHLLKCATNIITKNGLNDDPHELLNYSLLQLLDHKDREKIITSGFGVFWLIKVMTNSVFSNTSSYHKQIRNLNHEPLNDYEYKTDDVETKEYILTTIETIMLDIEKKNIEGWYMVNLFKLWVDKRNYNAIMRDTKIPRNSITRAVVGCKKIILQELKNRNINYEF